MKRFLYLLLLLFCLVCDCSSEVERMFDKYSLNDAYTINKIKKQRNNVYIIYAVRNDSVFKIVSHFNGFVSDNEIKLKKGIRFSATLRPCFNGNICGLQTMHQIGLAIDYYGVSVFQEPQNNIDEIYFCDDINGKYIDIRKTVIGKVYY